MNIKDYILALWSKKKIPNPWYSFLTISSLFAIAGVITFCFEWLHRQSFFATKDWILQNKPLSLVTYCFVFLVLLFFYFLFSRLHWATWLTNLIFMTLGLINHFKILMRNEPLMPWDFMLNQELTNIMQHIELEITRRTVIITIIPFIIGLIFIWIEAKPPKIHTRLGGAFIVFFITIFTYKGLFINANPILVLPTENIFWNQVTNYKVNGSFVCFGMNIKNILITPPDDYSKANIDRVVQEINTNQNIKDGPITTPNIIMIMGEALWDPTLMEGTQYSTNPIPNIESIRENGASGWIMVPQFGGGTSNTEFEALTGHSISFLPPGSMAYQQYIKQNIPSLLTLLEELNYKRTALHPYEKWFWSRETVYPHLGFEKFISQDDFVNPEIKGSYISDHEVSQRIIKEYEAANGSPFFNFTVTMQGHAPYPKDRYPDHHLTITESPLSDSNEAIFQSFVQGVYDMDAALGELIDYFSKQEDPTVIVLFGDHLPILGNNYEIYREGGYLPEGDLSLEDSKNVYSTPIVMWSNYDLPKKDLKTMSSYYIAPTLLEYLDLPIPPYFEFLLGLRDQTPAFIRGLTIDSNSELSNVLTPSQQALFDDYWLLQYDLMFGDRLSQDMLWAK